MPTHYAGPLTQTLLILMKPLETGYISRSVSPFSASAAYLYLVQAFDIFRLPKPATEPFLHTRQTLSCIRRLNI